MDDHPNRPIDPDLAPSDPAAPAVVTPRRAVRHSRLEPDVLVAIALGGMAGASARFELAEALPTAAGQFPWATFWTNLSGSFVLGFLLVVLLERCSPTRYLRPFLTTGIIGAYTTMSTYVVETVVLIKDGHATTGVLYCAGSLVVGVLLAAAGITLGRRTTVPPGRGAAADDGRRR